MMANTMVSDPYSQQQHHDQFTGGFRNSNSYPPTATMKKRQRTARSTSIPINRGSIMRKTASEYQIAQDEAEADIRDYLFFSRVVDGFERQNSLLQDDSYLKSTNETLIDNIVKSRHATTEEHHQQQQQCEEEELKTDDDHDDYHYTYYYHNQNNNSNAMATQLHKDLKIVSPVNHHCYVDAALSFSPEQDDNECENDNNDGDDDDEGVFDFEL
jgi:hypothetical protein